MGIKLLAYDGKKDNQRFGKLGILLHDTTKWMIRTAITAIYRKMKPVIDYKLKEGWINPYVGQLYKDWTWTIQLDERKSNTKIGGFKGSDDKNRTMFHNMRDIVCTLLDEDTHYGIRVGVMMFRMHENWDKYEIAANSANEFMRYREMYERLKDIKDTDTLDSVGLPQLDDDDADTMD